MKFSKQKWMGGLREKYQNDVLHGSMNIDQVVQGGRVHILRE